MPGITLVKKNSWTEFILLTRSTVKGSIRRTLEPDDSKVRCFINPFTLRRCLGKTAISDLDVRVSRDRGLN